MGSDEAIYQKEVHIFYYPCEFQTNCKPIVRYFNPGLYLFELYGAAGGSTEKEGHLFYGGKGGYTRGAIQFYQRTKVYMFIGGKGTTATSGYAYGGWNGGGSGKTGGLNYMAAGGGGSTDIRIQCSSISCRQMIAGGGGGAGVPNVNGVDNMGYGGSGGGEIGVDSAPLYEDKTDNKGLGGTQHEGGKGGKALGSSSLAPDGSLFYGGNMEFCTDYFESSCGGGGGGLYGGGAGAATGGGGGSGYISDLFFSIENYQNQTINGDSQFPDVNGTLITGNPSSGMIKITVFSLYFVPFSHYNSISISFKIFVLIFILYSS